MSDDFTLGDPHAYDKELERENHGIVTESVGDVHSAEVKRDHLGYPIPCGQEECSYAVEECHFCPDNPQSALAAMRHPSTTEEGTE